MHSQYLGNLLLTKHSRAHYTSSVGVADSPSEQVSISYCQLKQSIMEDLPMEVLFNIFQDCENGELRNLRETNIRLSIAVKNYVKDQELCDECELPLFGPSCPKKEFVLFCSGEGTYDCPVRLHGTCCGFPEEAILEDIDFDFSCNKCRGLHVNTYTENVYEAFGFEKIPVTDEADSSDSDFGSQSNSSNSSKSEPMSDVDL